MDVCESIRPTTYIKPRSYLIILFNVASVPFDPHAATSTRRPSLRIRSWRPRESSLLTRPPLLQQPHPQVRARTATPPFSLAAVQLGSLSSFLDFLFRISSRLARSFLTKSRHSIFVAILSPFLSCVFLVCLHFAPNVSRGIATCESSLPPEICTKRAQCAVGTLLLYSYA